MSYAAYYQARDTLLDFIRRDAIGPVNANEVLEEPPLETYVCGVLWPKIVNTSADNSTEDDRDEVSAAFDGDPEDEMAEVINGTSRYKPSVMAMSFVLPEGLSAVEIQFDAASYDHSEVISKKTGESSDETVTKTYKRHLYTRTALSSGKLPIALRQGLSLPLLGGRAILRASLRRRYHDGSCMWTVSVENMQLHSRLEIEQNCRALFQCQLRLYGKFLPIGRNRFAVGSNDRKMQDLLYRNVHQYAAGHGCSVQWEDNSGLMELSSDFLPYASVPQMIAALPTGSYDCFRMDFWQDDTKVAAISKMREYIHSYEHWKESLIAESAKLNSAYSEAAAKAINQITLCTERLSNGVAILENDPTAWRAFVYANEAMKRQSAKKRGQTIQDVSWYPFQLCYIIMCIPDIVNPKSRWHDTVDLLWFPTGGGKTEAYLGVAAFTVFFRRLTAKELGRGVAVLMRYTLRMLTAQQFERAAALICECELIRRRDHIPGGEISIGMWVGSAVTPNHVVSTNEDQESAETVLNALQRGDIFSVASSPVQLISCPHCGKPLSVNSSYYIINHEFHARCSSPECPFHDELPIVTVDDDIYKRRPTLLISTIDKFARLAWESRAGAIFSVDGDGLPPSLLIQDELHLISGPLGSISGLYEIAVDQLCTKYGVGPKIIASTATVCNASGQIQSLYGRNHFQFPPSGLDHKDSFFARQANADERPERLYVGYCETGGSLVDAIVRTFGSITFALQYLRLLGTPDEVIDQFWTNVGYFNSLKDLGSADTLILDRVRAYAESLRRHKFAAEASRVAMPAFAESYEHGELTSRKSAREITEIRTILDHTHFPEKAAYSYILSSNMLSVGIDISRLGLMTVYGQPKSTAEYIQATSRVGRSNPGLVVVLLHMMRARDKGHFEQFKAYHQGLNRMVEPTSAAPYACRALEKALHAVFVILIRHQIRDLREDTDACNFRTGRADVQAILGKILTRIQQQSPETYDYAKDLLDNFILQWEDEAIRKRKHFRYTLANCLPDNTDVLLTSAEQGDDALFPPTMNSMRNVDTQSNVYLMERRTTP